MAFAHLPYDPVAAGRSTFAIRLVDERKAVRFAIDDWMHILFSEDRRSDMNIAWVMTRVARCQAVILSTCAQILASGTDAVLAIGSKREQDRRRTAPVIVATGHQARFYFVDADLAARRQRVAARNAQRGDTYSLEVTPSMFEAIEPYFERPTERESGPVVVLQRASHG